MVMLIVDALILETILKILDRLQTKPAVYVAEGNRGDQALHVAQ